MADVWIRADHDDLREEYPGSWGLYHENVVSSQPKVGVDARGRVNNRMYEKNWLTVVCNNLDCGFLAHVNESRLTDGLPQGLTKTQEQYRAEMADF